MIILDSIVDAGMELSQRDREKLWRMVIEYVTCGVEPDETGAAMAVFTAVRPSLDNNVARQEAGKKGGRPRKTQKQNETKPESKTKANGKQTQKQNETKPESKTKPSPKANGKQTLRKTESEDEYEDEYITCNPTIAANSTYDDGGGGGFPKFKAEALKAYNAATGQNVMALPVDAEFGLRKAYDNGRTLSDVGRVLKVVAGWEPRFVTPNAAFGDKFEQWLNKPEAPALVGHGLDQSGEAF